MTFRGRLWLVAPMAAAVVSCNGSTGSGAGAGDAAPSGTSSGETADAAPSGLGTDAAVPSMDGSPLGLGAIDASACGSGSPAPTTLAGTWDVQGSSVDSTPTSATIVIDASHFTFTEASGDSLTFADESGALTLTWKAASDAPVPIATTHAAGALAEGIVPLAIGGQWTFSGSPSLCQAAIGAPMLTASCTGSSDFPAPFDGHLDGAIQGVRTSSSPSLFGDLGGTWHLSDLGGGSGSCDATFVGNTFGVTCSAAVPFEGAARFTFCDGIAAGSTSSGVEFSALRR